MPIPVARPRTFAVAALVAVAAAVAAWLVNPPVYFTNDDVAVRLALEGRAVPGEPASGYALFPSAALGWAIAFAHQFAPGVPLWDLVVAATLLAAVAVFGTVMWTAAGRSWMARAAAVAALVATTAPLVTGIHYTVSATLAGGAGMLLVVVELEARERRRWGMIALGAALVLAGMLVRPMGAMAGAAAIAVFLVPLVPLRALRLRYVAAALAATLALYVAVQSLDAALYALNAEWDAYYRYHGIVQRLYEWGGELTTRDSDSVRAAVGWSANDWQMLQAAFGVDPALHGLDRVSKAYETRAAMVGWDGIARWAVERLGAVDAADAWRVLAAAAASLVAGGALAVACGARGAAAAAGVAVLFCAFCVATELVFKELPFRLLAPLATCAVAALGVAAGALGGMRSAFASVVAVGVVLAIAGAEVPAALASAAAEYRHSQQVDREVGRLQALEPSLVVLHSDTFPSEHWWRPFRQPPVELRAVSLGWNNQSPALQRFLTHSGRQPLLRALCDDPSLLIVGEEDRLEFVTTYLREHFGRAAEWSDVFAGSFRAWRCVNAGS